MFIADNQHLSDKSLSFPRPANHPTHIFPATLRPSPVGLTGQTAQAIVDIRTAGSSLESDIGLATSVSACKSTSACWLPVPPSREGH